MKYLVLLCDGMADTPVPALGGKTPMEAAHKPHMDALAARAAVGVAKTVPDGMKPGSDVANLSALGYRPAECYTGRSPLEAASIGIELSPSQYAIRCNFVTLSDEKAYADKRMLDYCGGDISTSEAAELVACLNAHLPAEMRLYTGVSYRHCLVWDNSSPDLGSLTPPHDISGRVIGNYLPDSPEAAPLLDWMQQSYLLLKEHPVNLRRMAEGKKPANSAWFWGQGRKAALENFQECYGVRAAVISAVDLIKGIGVLAGMEVIEVEGATGYLDTNFDGKAQAAIDAFRRGNELVYLHVEAPDECGHRGETENKVRAIELIDQKILGPVLRWLEAQGDFRVMVLPDHPTPLATMTHSPDPVPYLLYSSAAPCEGVSAFTEALARENAVKQNRFIPDASALMKILIDL